MLSVQIRINRNIVECKDWSTADADIMGDVLIETLWNVKCFFLSGVMPVTVY